MDLERIDPEEAKARLDADDGSIYLDVRSRAEFASGHAPGAVNIPLLDQQPGSPGLAPNPNFVAEVRARFQPDQQLITACLRGGRSMRAAQALIAEGFTKVVDMRGGWDGELDPAGNVVFEGWARRGYPSTTE